MAEYVQARMEETIPELEQMQRLHLFDKHEIKAIANKRKEFEYKIQRLTKCKEDYLRFIQYELDLLKLIKIRREKSRMFIKRNEIEHTITNRVDKMFKKVIQRFQSDVKLWISHIKFCKEVGFTSAISSIFVRMLAVHSDKPNVWKFAAAWEFEQSSSIENARSFALRGLRFHPESALLYREAICMELRHAERERALRDEKEAERRAYAATEVKAEEETDDPVLRGRLAEVFLESSFDHVHDVHFYVGLLDVTARFDFAAGLRRKIVGQLLSAYRDDERVWDLMGRRELAGYALDHKHVAGGGSDVPGEDFDVKAERSLRENIHMSSSLYREAVKALPTERMWAFYIEMLAELNRDPSELPKYKEQLLLNAFEDAHGAGLLSEAHYLQWMDLLESLNLQHRCGAALERATERFPGSAALWQRYLVCLRRCGGADPMAAFDRAVVALGAKCDEALPLWTDMIQHCQEADVALAERVFERALALGTGVSTALKPIYLDWLNVVKGIKEVRLKHASLSLHPPLCLELHTKMIELEVAQPKVNAKQVRKCYDLATHQFGKDNYDLWLNYIKFELGSGEAKYVSRIYDRAIKTLDEQHLELLISKYSLMKSGTSL